MLSCLLDASWNGGTEVVNLLIEKGADIHVKTNDGRSPLQDVIGYGRTEVVNLLIEKGADIHVKDNNVATPLYLASSWGQ